MALILATTTIFMSTMSVLAVEERTVREGTTHPWGELVDSLDTDDYSGIYVEEGKLHIAAVNEQKISLAVSRSRAVESSIVIDTAAKYTYQQLLDAQTALNDNHSSLGINATYLDPINNSIVVRSTEWTDEKKQAVLDCALFDNIIFEISSNEIYDDVGDDIDDKAEQSFTRDLPRYDDVVNGDLIDKSSGGSYSVGCGVVYNRSTPSKTGYGYITSAHGMKSTDTIEYKGQKLGTIYALSNSGALDVCVIKEPKNPTLFQSSFLIGSNDSASTVTQSDRPVQGETVYMYGFASYMDTKTNPQVGTVTLVNGTQFTDDKNVIYKGLVETNYSRRNGDSGAPVIALRNGESTL